MGSERHFGVLDEVSVDRERRVAVFGRHGFQQSVPGRAGRRCSRIPPLKEKDVDDDVRSCAVVHCAFGEPHGADEIGHGCDVLARLSIDLVHRPARGHERCEAAGPQPLDGAREKKVVQGEAQRPGRIVGAHGAVGEGRIADREIVELRQSRLREILVADAGVRIEEFCDPGGRCVHFDARQRELARQRLRRKREEEARPAAGLEDAPAGKAHAAERPPDGADDELGCEMGVLRRALQACEVLARDGLFELEADLLPCPLEILVDAAEDLVCDIRGAEGDESREALLLVRTGVAAFRPRSPS